MTHLPDEPIGPLPCPRCDEEHGLLECQGAVYLDCPRMPMWSEAQKSMETLEIWRATSRTVTP